MSKPPADSGFAGFAVPLPNRAKDSLLINRHLKDSADPMRTTWDCVTFPRHRAIRFPDPRRVGARQINLYNRIGKTSIKFCQRASNKGQSSLIIGKIDLIQKVGTVAGIRKNWLPPLTSHLRRYCSRPYQRGLVLVTG